MRVHNVATAQVIRFEGDPLWYVNLILEDGRDFVSDQGYDSPASAEAALRQWAEIGERTRQGETLH